MTTQAKACIASILPAFLLCMSSAQAGLILGQFDWDDGSLQGWQSDNEFAQLQPQPVGGDPDGWLEITLPATTPEAPEDEWFDIVYTPADSLFAGGWETNMWVQFDFWSTDDRSPDVQVRWQSASNDYVWAHDVSERVTDGWSTMGASLMKWTDWDTLTPIGASEEQYLDDLATIDWIGIYIGRDGTDEQIYGLDDFKLAVPEPAEFILLGAALMTSAASLRKKRRKALVDPTG